MLDAAALSVHAEPVHAEDLEGLAPVWSAVRERASDRNYALTLSWLRAWAATGEPGPLSVLEVRDGSTAVAVGLLERRSGGRWRFAGGDVTPHRRLLSAEGAESAAWDALWTWLASRPSGWQEIEATGGPPGVPSPDAARRFDQPEFALDLPASFEDYLAQRSSGTRKGLKGKLRRLEREGAEVRVVEPDRHEEALADFVRLHAARAADKGERHDQVDSRLADLLARLPHSEELALTILELRAGEDVAGVSVRVDDGDTAYFYNSGIDPARGELSPGVCLELGSIRDAIERGLRRFDLGPGDWRYKHDLGGERSERVRIIAAAPSLRGRALRLLRRLRG